MVYHVGKYSFRPMGASGLGKGVHQQVGLGTGWEGEVMVIKVEPPPRPTCLEICMVNHLGFVVLGGKNGSYSTSLSWGWWLFTPLSLHEHLQGGGTRFRQVTHPLGKKEPIGPMVKTHFMIAFESLPFSCCRCLIGRTTRNIYTKKLLSMPSSWKKKSKKNKTQRPHQTKQKHPNQKKTKSKTPARILKQPTRTNKKTLVSFLVFSNL